MVFRLRELGSRHVLQKMTRQYGQRDQRLHTCHHGIREAHLQCHRVENRDLLKREEVAATPIGVFRLASRRQGPGYILYGERCAVVPDDIVSDGQDQPSLIGLPTPFTRQVGAEFAALSVKDQWREEQQLDVG